MPTDTERINAIVRMTKRGLAPQIMYDDDGNFAVSFSASAPLPRGGGRGYVKNVEIVTHVKKDEWRPTLRQAIDHAVRNGTKDS
jgi:hypothetical protein